MVATMSPDWIPAGWIEQIKVTNGRKTKYYYNMETGQKFYSKKDLIQYVETVNLCCDVPNQTSKLDETSSELTLEHSRRSSGRSKKAKRSSEPGDNERSSEPGDNERSETIPECNETKSEIVPEHDERSSEPTPPAMKTDETPEWLPQGWIIEMKGSRKYKCYVEQATRRKFYSKPQVFAYLEVAKLDSSTSPSQQKKMGNDSVSDASMGELAGGKTYLNLEGSHNRKTLEGTSSSKSNRRGFRKKLVKKVVIERLTPDGLPPGWIKEIRIEKKSNGIRKDPYYTDPVSGYVFRSLRDALRYLETGDITVCAIKPKKREEMSFLNEEKSVNEFQEE